MNEFADSAIPAIEGLTASGKHLSYAWLKSEYGRVQISDEVYKSLKYGRVIISSVDQLNQYLYSYSPMVASQWEHACKFISARVDDTNCRLVDYGCGQGLAGLLLHDHLGPLYLSAVRSIIAIEPSLVALRRAEVIYRVLAPEAYIVPVNKVFTALQNTDFAVGDGSTIHLFSNVLDIDGYDHVGLLRKALRPGKHTIIAVGHDRTSHGYSRGLMNVKAAVDAGTIAAKITIELSELESFLCGNRGEPAVLWLCKLEVSDG